MVGAIQHQAITKVLNILRSASLHTTKSK